MAARKSAKQTTSTTEPKIEPETVTEPVEAVEPEPATDVPVPAPLGPTAIKTPCHGAPMYFYLTGQEDGNGMRVDKIGCTANACSNEWDDSDGSVLAWPGVSE